jgi:hypothetical protein
MEPKPENEHPDSGEIQDAMVVLRVTRREKNRWVTTAQRAGKKLATWMRDVLNGSSDDLPPRR